METSLYDNKEGFYAKRKPTEDFYTAPELHPSFAITLADHLAGRLARLAEMRPKSPLFLMEVGAGAGTLACQVLAALSDKHPHWINRVRFILVERVEHLMMESVLRLHDTGVRHLGYTHLEEVPPFCGVVYSNELIDAMPVHVLEKKDGRVREVYVERPHGKKSRRPRTTLGLLSSRRLVHAARAVGPHLEEGQRHAVNLEAQRWISRIARILKAGSVITIDYGKRFTPGIPNPPRTFYRHTLGDDIVKRPGQEDLTASVDFNQLIEHGEKAGLRMESYSTLGKFLLENGILDLMPKGDSLGAFKERNRIKTLFHPDGMGEKFKVLIQEKGV